MTQQRTILIIEDEPSIMTFASKLLEIMGHRILRAEDGAEGIKVLAEDAVDLVLLDLMIPGPDGWAILRQMKEDPRLSRIPVIVFSAYAEQSKMDAARELGVTEYLVKPISASTLRETIETVLAREES